VEFSGPFLILRPSDPARSNGATIFEVANRGSTQMDGVMSEFDSLSLTANKTRDVSRPALFDLGYTFAWAAWQGDLQPDQFALKVPTAEIRGPVRSAAFLGIPGESSDASPVSAGWCAAEAEDPRAVLRLHRSFDDPGELIPRTAWRFARRDKDGTIIADACAFLLAKPVTKPALATVVYDTSGSKMMGLGQAAVRDFASHLKHREVRSPLNARPGDARQLIAFGYSQSGRFLRDFVYRGFNSDTQGRRVFDGILDTASGAGRGSFNHRFATPGQAGNSVGSALRAVDLYPFADTPTPDISGRGSEGLLDRSRAAGVQPKIFHILTSSEYWARAGSLLHTTTDGKRPLRQAEGTRTYAFAGTPHGPRRATTFLTKDAKADYPYNDNEDLFLAMPALVEAMRRWIAEGREPPASRHPLLATTLVSASQLNFPKLRRVVVPAGPPPVWQLDLGPDYRTKGILAEPPKIGRRYPLLVPQVDRDGNELGSWRGLASSVPLGTYTAWNHQLPELDSFGYLSGLQGAFFPLPLNEEARKRQGDPRLSVNARYGGLHGYMAAAERAIEEQVRAGFLLPQERDQARTWMRLVWDRAEELRRHWPPADETRD
jgi:hypothetical protein